jgi:hypothetical protein
MLRFAITVTQTAISLKMHQNKENELISRFSNRLGGAAQRKVEFFSQAR